MYNEMRLNTTQWWSPPNYVPCFTIHTISLRMQLHNWFLELIQTPLQTFTIVKLITLEGILLFVKLANVQPLKICYNQIHVCCATAELVTIHCHSSQE